jgi:hypothetical protein
LGGTGGAVEEGGDGDANTGGGGGGGRNSGGDGGSGIVVISYADTFDAPSSITGTYSEPSVSGKRVYKFTGSGTITWTS